MDDFLVSFNQIINEIPFTEEIGNEIGSHLKSFDEEEFRGKAINIGIKVLEKLKENKLQIRSEFFDIMNNYFFITQNWRQIINLCNYIMDNKGTLPMKSMNMVRENMLYCNDTKVRGEIKYALKEIEKYGDTISHALKKE